jgi:hypothetical protein
MKFWAFWAGVFSDNGSPSFSRIGTAIALLCSCAWVTHIVWQTKALPDFSGVCFFIGTLYGLNVVRNLRQPPQ